jgi:CRISPR-associated endonuclease/helicase Cas3
VLFAIKSDLTTLCSYKLKSHRDKLLVDHLEEVGRLSQRIVDSTTFVNRTTLAEVAYLIGITHDFGKATNYFQELLSMGARTHYANHGLLSSLFSYQVIKEYLSKKGKYSEEFKWLPALAWVAVKRHHGNIHNLIGDDKSEAATLRDIGEQAVVKKQIENILAMNRGEVLLIFNKLLEGIDVLKCLEEIYRWDNLTKEIRLTLGEIRREARMENYLTLLFLYSVLVDVDKVNAAGVNLPLRVTDIKANLVDEYRKETFLKSAETIGAIREQAYQEISESTSTIDIRKDRLLSINLPTGTGKTLSSFSFALKLRERVSTDMGFVPRIIYCLPFLSIIDQNSDVLSKVLQKQFKEIPSNVFLKHHHLSDISYTELNDEELHPTEEANKALLLIEAWDSEIIISTFMQFFHSLVTNQNKAARKFHNMANSIIILDEVQAIPSKYWLLINRMLRDFTVKFNSWIVLMTATQPLIFQPNEMRELTPDKCQYFNLLDRVNFQVDLDEKGKVTYQTFEQFKEPLRDVIKTSKKDIMVIVNTIGLCQQIYEFLKSNIPQDCSLGEGTVDDDGICNFSELELIALSTHVLPRDRLRRIRRIKEDTCRKVIVATQLVEAGVDINTAIVYRDLAPLDCIIQAAGRCNRNGGKEKGLFIIVPLKDEAGRPFHHFVYEDELIDATKRVLSELGNRFSERDLGRAVDNYYSLVHQRSSFQESGILIQCLEKLDLSESERFELIENGDEEISVFIERDEETARIRERIQSILMEDKKFERKAKLAALKREINENTINIRHSWKLKKLATLPTIFGEEFRYVPRNQVQKWYKRDIGFSIPEGE